MDEIKNPLKYCVMIVAVVLIITGIICVLLGIRTIDTGTVGIKTEFGKATGEIIEPGLRIITPIKDKIIGFDLRIKKEEVEAGAATEDMQDVMVTIAVNYHVNSENVMDIFSKIGDDDNLRDKLIAPAIQEVVKASTASYKAEELLRNRVGVKKDIDTMLKERLAEYWIVVDDVSIVNLSFSAEFDKAIENKQVAEQKAEQAKYDVQKAKQEMERMKLQDKNLTDKLLKKMYLEKWNGVTPKYWCGDGGGLFIGMEEE